MLVSAWNSILKHRKPNSIFPAERGYGLVLCDEKHPCVFCTTEGSYIFLLNTNEFSLFIYSFICGGEIHPT